MKAFHMLICLIVAIAISAVAGVVFAPLPKSPNLIYPTHTGPGTSHAFGYGIEYTVVGHAAHDGKLHAIIVSSAPGEGHVQIWSPIPDLVVLNPGQKFRLARAENFSRALQVGDARP